MSQIKEQSGQVRSQEVATLFHLVSIAALTISFRPFMFQRHHVDRHEIALSHGWHSLCYSMYNSTHMVVPLDPFE